MVTTARVILGVVTNPDIPLTLSAVAERTGLTVEAVREILNGKAYQDLIGDHLRVQVSTLMMRGLMKMDRIVHGEYKASDQIAAYRSIVATFDSASKSLPRAVEAGAEDDLEKALRVLDKLRKPEAKVRDEGKRIRKAPAREAATAGEGD